MSKTKKVPVEPLGALDDGHTDNTSSAEAGFEGVYARWADVPEENADDWDARNWHRGTAGQRGPIS